MIRVSNPRSEGIYQGSKWLKVPVLCDAEELSLLFDHSFFIVPLTGLCDGKVLEPKSFLDTYAEWIEQLKQGKVPSDPELRKILACGWTESLESVWLQEIPTKGFLTKISSPIIQVQAHYFSYSRLDRVFRSMSMGEGSVFWGLQFSFPQLFQDPKTMEIHTAGKYPLFEKVRLWAREHTRATPFLVDGTKTNVPIRLGKKCFSWIEKHPQLQEQGIRVDS